MAHARCLLTFTNRSGSTYSHPYRDPLLAPMGENGIQEDYRSVTIHVNDPFHDPIWGAAIALPAP